MDWNHEKYTLDGNLIFTPGTLVQINLTKHCLIDAKTPTIDVNTWRLAEQYIKDFGEQPTVMVINLDPMEIYYQILLDEKTFWFPLVFTTNSNI